MIKGYGLGDDGNPAPLIDTIEKAFKPYDCPEDDVRLAIHQCAQSDGDTKAAYGRLAAVAREEGVEPLDMIAGLDIVDEKSWQNANTAVGLVNSYAAKPKYVEPEAPPPPSEGYDNSYEAARAAARAGMNQAVSPEDYRKAEPHLKNLAHRNGSAVDFIDNTLAMRAKALSGDDKLIQQARQTAYNHYAQGHGVNPLDFNSTRDIAQVRKVFPDLKTDPELRTAVAEELTQNGKFYPDRDDNNRPIDGVTMIALARAKVLQDWHNE